MAFDPQFAQFVQQALAAAQGGAVSGLEDAPEVVGNMFYPGVHGVEQYPGTVQGYDVVGALNVLQAAQKAALAPGAPMAAMPQIRAQAAQGGMWAPGVYNTGDRPATPRRKVLGFPLTTILAGSTTPAAQPNVLPQEAIRPERLIIEDLSTGSTFDLMVDDIKVGAQSQNIGTGPIPASSFASNAFDTLFGGNTLNPGIVCQINLRLNAVALANRVFAISIIGISIQQ